MIQKLKPKSEFSRNVLTLMTGTTIAQAIPIAISPILTRIYTPEDFGLFALYMSIVMMLSTIVTARYELAILLPRNNKDAINILILSLMISTIISLLILIIVILFNNSITNKLGNPELSHWLYFVPFSIFITGIYQSLIFWKNRQKRYKLLANNKIIMNGTTTVTHLIFGTFRLGSMGLIFGYFSGQIISLYFLIKDTLYEDSHRLKDVSKIKMFLLGKRYIRFPKYDILAAFSNVASHQLIHLFLNIYFTSIVAGYFYLAQKMLSTPISMIALAIQDVFKEKAAKDYAKYSNAAHIYKKTIKKLFFISLLPSLLLYLYSVEIFVFIFGKEWIIAGEYAKILTPMLFLRFISTPLSYMIYIGEKQYINLIMQLILLIFICFSFYFGENAHETIIYISIIFSIFYFIQIIVSSIIAKIYNNKEHYSCKML